MEAKYGKNEKVYTPTEDKVEVTMKCPDCLGTKVWMVIFPSGQVEDIDCQTCARGYEGPKGELTFTKWKDEVSFRYMCKETGVGSGHIYREDELFTNQEDAMKLARERSAKHKRHVAKRNFKTREDIERMLNTYGYKRSVMPEIVEQFMSWVRFMKDENKSREKRTEEKE